MALLALILFILSSIPFLEAFGSSEAHQFTLGIT